MDQPRYLAKRSEVGYTVHLSTALRDEPEAVPAEDQERLTTRVHRAVAQARRDTWAETRDALRKQADWHMARVRACEKEIRRLESKLAGRPR